MVMVAVGLYGGFRATRERRRRAKESKDAGHAHHDHCTATPMARSTIHGCGSGAGRGCRPWPDAYRVGAARVPDASVARRVPAYLLAFSLCFGPTRLMGLFAALWGVVTRHTNSERVLCVGNRVFTITSLAVGLAWLARSWRRSLERETRVWGPRPRSRTWARPASAPRAAMTLHHGDPTEEERRWYPRRRAGGLQRHRHRRAPSGPADRGRHVWGSAREYVVRREIARGWRDGRRRSHDFRERGGWGGGDKRTTESPYTGIGGNGEGLSLIAIRLFCGSTCRPRRRLSDESDITACAHQRWRFARPRRERGAEEAGPPPPLPPSCNTPYRPAPRRPRIEVWGTRPSTTRRAAHDKPRAAAAIERLRRPRRRARSVGHEGPRALAARLDGVPAATGFAASDGARRRASAAACGQSLIQ